MTSEPNQSGPSESRSRLLIGLMMGLMFAALTALSGAGLVETVCAGVFFGVLMWLAVPLSERVRRLFERS